MPSSTTSGQAFKNRLPAIILVIESGFVGLIVIFRNNLFSFLDSFAGSDRLLGFVLIGVFMFFAVLSYVAVKLDPQDQTSKPGLVRRIHYTIWGISVIILSVFGLIALLK